MANLPAKKNASGNFTKHKGTISAETRTERQPKPVTGTALTGKKPKLTAASSHDRSARTPSTTSHTGRVTAQRNGTVQLRPASKTTTPKRFIDGEHGLSEWTGSGYRRFCSGMRWVGHVVDADGGNPAHVLDIWTLNGIRKRTTFAHEAAVSPQEIARCLTARGAQLACTREAARQVGDYLSTRPRGPVYTRAPHNGWQTFGDVEAYVLNEKAFSSSKHEIHVMPERTQTPRKRSGTLAGWLEITKLCNGNPLLTVSLCAAFASALLHPLDHDGFGVSFVGRSSTGKTTALRLALALTDSPGELANWATTANGLEALAASRAHMPLVLDEIGLADEGVLSDVTYRLTNSSGKLRAKRDGSLAPTARLCTVSISAGEESIIERIEHGGPHAKLGQFARVITLPTNLEYGLFAHLHGSSNGAAFAEKLSRMLHEVHGVAWEPFVEHVATRLSVIKSWYAKNVGKVRADLVKGIEFDTHENVCARVLDHFVLMYVAGRAAANAGVIALAEREIFNAVRQCFTAWIEQYQERLVAPGQAIRDEVLYFLQKHRHCMHRWSEYSNADRDTRIGFTYSLKGGAEVLLVFPGALAAMRKTHGDKAFHSALIDTAWLLPTPNGRPTQQRRLPPPEQGRVGMYVFSKSAIFGAE